MKLCIFLCYVVGETLHTIISCIKKVLITKYKVIAIFLCEECVFHSQGIFYTLNHFNFRA